MPPAQWLVAWVIAGSPRSYSVTLRPARCSSSACQAPAMPAPITETGASLRRSGSCPRSDAESEIADSCPLNTSVN